MGALIVAWCTRLRWLPITYGFRGCSKQHASFATTMLQSSICWAC